MKTLRTVYPYGLNDRTNFMNKDVPTGQLFPPLSRHGTKFVGKRTRSSVRSRTDLDSLIQSISSSNKEEQSNKFRILLLKLKHSTLRKLAAEASSLLSTCQDNLKRRYDLTIDTFFTKTFKNKRTKNKHTPKSLLPIFFHNKGLDFINLNKILRTPHVVSLLPNKLQEVDPPAVVYNLSSTIRNKIFNYKQTVSDIDIHDTATYGTDLPSCDCHNSPFVVQLWPYHDW